MSVRYVFILKPMSDTGEIAAAATAAKAIDYLSEQGFSKFATFNRDTLEHEELTPQEAATALDHNWTVNVYSEGGLSWQVFRLLVLE